MSSTRVAGVRGAAVRRVLKWLGAAAAVLVAVIVVAIGALHTAPGRRFVLSRITQLLAAQQIDLRADQLRYNLFDLSLDLRNVTIRSARSAEDPPFAVLAGLTANLSLMDLLGGRYVVESAALDGARVHYLVDADGDNLPRPPRDPNAPSQPVDYLVASLSATNATVRYENRAQQIDVVMPVQTLSVRGDRLTDRHAISLSAQDGRLRAEGRDVRVTALSADFSLGDDDVDIVNARVEAEGSRVEVEGTLDHFADPTIAARVRATLDVARAARLAALEDPAKGQLAFDAKASGLMSALQVDARLEGRALGFRALDALSLDAHLGYDGRTRLATAQNLHASAPWGSVTGNGAVSFSDTSSPDTSSSGAPSPGAPSHASVRVSGLDVRKLMRGLALPQVVATIVDGTVEARWPGFRYAEASGNADVLLTPAQARVSRSTLPVGGRMVLKGDAGRLNARVVNLRAAGARVNGSVSLIDGERLAGALRGSVTDIASAAAAAEAFL